MTRETKIDEVLGDVRRYFDELLPAIQSALAEIRAIERRLSVVEQRATAVSIGKTLPMSEAQGRFRVVPINVEGEVVNILVLDDTTPPGQDHADVRREFQ